MADNKNLNLPMECPAHLGKQHVVKSLHNPIDKVIHITLGCGCTLELKDNAVSKPAIFIRPGDVVRWNSQLFVVTKVAPEDEFIWATIVNVNGDDEVPLDWLEFVGKDTLTKLDTATVAKNKYKQDQEENPLYKNPHGRKTDIVKDDEGSRSKRRYDQEWSANDGYSYGGQTWSKPPKTKIWQPKPKKQDSIDTASLIESEVKELKDENSADKKYSWEDDYNKDYSYSSDRDVGETRPLRSQPPKVVKENSLPTKPVKFPKRRGDW